MTEKQIGITIFSVGTLCLVGFIYWMSVSLTEARKNDEARRVEYEKTRIVFGDYVRLTRLDCNEIRKDYPKKLTKGLQDFDLGLTSCGETYANFYLKYSLIRYKQTMYKVFWDWANEEHEAQITRYNVPYCVIGTDKAEFAVEQPCEKIP